MAADNADQDKIQVVAVLTQSRVLDVSDSLSWDMTRKIISTLHCRPHIAGISDMVFLPLEICNHSTQDTFL